MSTTKKIKKSIAFDVYIDHAKIFESLPGLYLILLPDLTIITASDAYLKATLTKREEIVGKKLFEVFPDNPDEIESTGELNLGASLKYVLKLKKEHKMALQRYDVRQSNGTFIKKYWQPLNRPVLNSLGEVVYIIHAAEDITGSVLADEERKKHEEENQRILKDLSDLKYAIDQSSIVSITDHKGIILDANDNFCKISGYDRDELIGSSHFIINSGHHTKGYFKEMWRTISSGKVWKGEIKNRAKGGKEYWGNTTIVPFLNELGKPYQYFAIRTEITDQKKAEEQLSKSNAMFTNLFDHNPASILIARLSDSVIINVNNSFISLFGFSNKKEVIGKKASSLSIVDDPIGRKEMGELLRKNGFVKDFEIQTCDVQGKPFWVSSSILIIEINGVQCLFSLAIDITHRKKAEEQLMAVNKELESFSYSVSHDLRAPLRSISGYTNILKEDYSAKLDHEGNRILGVISNSAVVMGQLIDELLAFSRIGKQKLFKVELQIEPMVQSVISELKHIYPDANYKLNTDLSEKIYGDNTLLKLVLTNLISNAIKYSGKKSQPAIEIKSKIENNQTLLWVKDNGAGFDMKYYDKLFGVFQRLHSHAEFEGTGVGLAIVERIVTKHGGKVWAESVPDEGATFYFSLPNN